MPETRPPIPRPLRRQVYMEAGHRCAIPTCKQVPVEIAHIIPWEQVREHAFENLIALCPTCHTRYDRGEIDRLSMKGYKANLGVITGRYGEVERRILDWCANETSMLEIANGNTLAVRLAAGWDLLVLNLIRDGLFVKNLGSYQAIDGMAPSESYTITPAGIEFIKKWVAAEPVSLEAEDDETTATPG